MIVKTADSPMFIRLIEIGVTAFSVVQPRAALKKGEFALSRNFFTPLTAFKECVHKSFCVSFLQIKLEKLILFIPLYHEHAKTHQ